jgi:hypothetical protein
LAVVEVACVSTGGAIVIPVGQVITERVPVTHQCFALYVLIFAVSWFKPARVSLQDIGGVISQEFNMLSRISECQMNSQWALLCSLWSVNDVRMITAIATEGVM